MTRLCPEGEVIEVWGNSDTPGDTDRPGGFVWRGAYHRIDGVCNRWRIHTNWWQWGMPAGALSPRLASTWREYLKVTTDSGLLCLLFRELEEGRGGPDEEGAAWYLARIYD